MQINTQKNPYLRYEFVEREEQWERQCGEWGSELVRLSVMGERVRVDSMFIKFCRLACVFIKFSPAELESIILKFYANFKKISSF